MTILKSLIVATALLAGGISLAIAQNGPATGGEWPVALMAAGLPTARFTATATGTCMPTRLTTTATGIGVTTKW
jgi:hypothetical protein